MGSRKGRVDGHCGEEEAAAGKAGPSGSARCTGVNVLNRDALLGTTKCLHDGVSVEVNHAACVFHKGMNDDVGPEALNKPGDHGDDKEEAGIGST